MRTPIAITRTLIAFCFFAVYITSFFIFSVLTLRRWNLRLSGPMLRFYGRTTLKILGLPLVLVNEWPFGEDEARVVIVNHQSSLDVVWFCAVCPGRMGTVGKRELIRVPVLNLAWWSLRLFLIDRSNSASAIATMKQATENTVKYRRSVSLAPEGTRSKDARILPFKKGVFHLAIEGRLPIYPIVMCGAADAMPKHSLIVYPHPITLRFLPPISTQEWDRERLGEHIAEVRQQMSDAYVELRAQAGLPSLSSQDS
jgi:1-acyl-sn-glycerol-3-phosphate acyltransferase